MLERPPERDPSIVNDLVLRWQRDHDERARDELVRRFLPVIRGAARKWGSKYRIDPGDADQEAAMAFLIAVDKFDPARGSLEHYAYIWARAKISRARTAAYVICVPPHVFNDTPEVVRTAFKLRDDLGRHATTAEVAAASGFTSRRVERALAALGLETRLASLNTPVGDDGESVTLGDTLPADESARPDVIAEESANAAAARDAIDAVLDGFVPRHREVVRLRLVEELTLEQAGNRMGITRERVRQIEAKALPRLREALRGNAAVAALLGREPAPEEVDDVDGLLLSAKDVHARTGLNPDELTEMVGRGDFPRPAARDRRGQRLWREGAVTRWQTQQQVPRPAVSDEPAQVHKTPMPSGPRAA